MLGQQKIPIINRYELSIKAWGLYKNKTFDGTPLRILKEKMDKAIFNRIESKLVNIGIIKPTPGISGDSSYNILGFIENDPRVIACAIDPFCYISHLSAMEFHGITDRMPEKLYVSTPSNSIWNEFSDQLMRKILGDDYENYYSEGLPILRKVNFEKLAGKPVHQFKSIHLGAFRNFKDQNFRVATLGRTFLDMIRDPLLCGGISHVISVFEEYGKDNKILIIDELNQHGKPIDKVRIGWIMENICGISDSRLEDWTKFAQRGGSRKLDGAAEYSSNFSERWALSINVPLNME